MNVAFTPAVLSDGSQIGVEVRSSNAGPGVVAVQLRRGEIVVDEVLLPYPSAGLGGGRIILSSSEQFALLSLFSGQSEEAYELFSVGHRLTSLASLSYQLGEAASYCFSPDDSLLVMALPFTCSEWWLPWDEGEVEPTPGGGICFGFGQLRVHETATGRVTVHELLVSAEEGWQPSRADYDPDLRPRFLEDSRVALSMPWGEIAVSLPAARNLVLPVGT
mgnify:CR=1 FL=1